MISETQILVPFIQGFPKQILGSTEIRRSKSSRSMLVSLFVPAGYKELSLNAVQAKM